MIQEENRKLVQNLLSEVKPLAEKGKSFQARESIISWGRYKMKTSASEEGAETILHLKD